jgi:zinc D-Ala-D-Ala carboxypeptidase
LPRDACSREGPLVRVAEQEQCFGEVDRSGVEGVEAVHEFAGVAGQIVTSHLEKRLRDRQRGAQRAGGLLWARLRRCLHTCRQRHAAQSGGVTYREPARATTRRIRIRRIRAAGLLAFVAAITAALVHQLPASSTPTPPIGVLRSPDSGRRSDHRRPLGEADGAVPDGTTVFEDAIPAVANLDPDLLGALRQAASDAADDAVTFFVDSGWRSPGYQEQLLHEAVVKYGSKEEAARWVASPEASAHVSGDAVDIGRSDAAAWLSEHGADYGLCQIYRNEPWHYELRPEAVDHVCPPMYADPTRDPRSQQALPEQSR